MRLVALTGYASERHREEALRAGFDDYLAKPVDLDTIKGALDGRPRGRRG
jgi:ActR/RegA family two-component response regulator